MAVQSFNDVLRYVANRDLLGSLPYRIAKKTVTSTQLLALRATAVALNAPAGTGQSWIPVYTVFQKQAGTAYVVAATTDLGLRYTDASGTTIAVLEGTGFMDQTTIQRRVLFGLSTAGAGTPVAAISVTPTEAAALVLHNVGAAEFTTGTGSVLVEVYGFLAKTTPVP